MFFNIVVTCTGLYVEDFDAIVCYVVYDFNSMFNGANAMIEQYSGTTGFGTASNNYTPSQSFFNQ